MFVSGLIHDAARRHSELVLMLSLAAPGHKTDPGGR